MTELEIMVEEIKKTSSQTAINKVDELKVMTCMLNDKDFKFDIYQRGNGKVAEVCPHDEMVSLATEIICTGTGLDKNTSNHLASNMTFSKSEARKILDLNKEFIDVYMKENIILCRMNLQKQISILKIWVLLRRVFLIKIIPVLQRVLLHLLILSLYLRHVVLNIRERSKTNKIGFAFRCFHLSSFCPLRIATSVDTFCKNKCRDTFI